MYEKFTERVNQVIKYANEIAREYDQEYVGTEHILLAILRAGASVGSTILERHGVNETICREEVDKLIKKRLEETWVFGRLPGTPHYRNVVATAIEQARQLESKEVCTEHLLLALAKEKGCVAARALKALGVSYKNIKAGVVQEAGGAN
jgi:ATP-dependent Clp protease ATP-binding subunit ClpC